MTSRWMFFPSPGTSFDFEAQGTTDSASGTGGSRDNDPTTSPSESDLNFITVRGTINTNSRIFFTFSNTTARNDFVSAYPNGSSAELVIGGVSYAASSISWNTFSRIALLASSQFGSWPSDVPVSTSYMFRIQL